MASLKIKGGNTLHGEITPQGAKNEAMQILCACLLTDEKVTIHNLPDILDINNLIALPACSPTRKSPSTTCPTSSTSTT